MINLLTFEHLLEESLLKAKETKPWTIQYNDQTFDILRVEVPFHLDDPVKWLKGQKLFPKVLWEDRNKDELNLTLGQNIYFNDLPKIKTHEKGSSLFEPKLFGGVPFNQEQAFSSPWTGAPKIGFFLPLVEVQITNGKSATFCIQCPESEFEKRVRDLTIENPSDYKVFHGLKDCTRTDMPSYKEYEKHIGTLLNYIDSKEVEKVVFSRTSTFSSESNFCPYSVIHHLRSTTKNSTLFAWIPEKHQAFLGASPEYLYNREGLSIKTFAVAGTRPRGKTEEEDNRLEQELFNTPKEVNEFNFVKYMLENALDELCNNFERKEIKVTKTPTVQHLYESFVGQLKDSVSDQDLINQLHPTPAMGGVPKEKALQLIHQLEPQARGYYASPLGWFSENISSVLVGIRSALINHQQITLFAGGGIVKGSDPLHEWKELEHKISQFTMC